MSEDTTKAPGRRLGPLASAVTQPVAATACGPAASCRRTRPRLRAIAALIPGKFSLLGSADGRARILPVQRSVGAAPDPEGRPARPRPAPAAQRRPVREDRGRGDREAPRA